MFRGSCPNWPEIWWRTRLSSSKMVGVVMVKHLLREVPAVLLRSEHIILVYHWFFGFAQTCWHWQDVCNCPEGAQWDSPGQRPGEQYKKPSPEGTKGVVRRPLRPFRAFFDGGWLPGVALRLTPGYLISPFQGLRSKLICPAFLFQLFSRGGRQIQTY